MVDAAGGRRGGGVTAAEIKAVAMKWYERELVSCATAHGDRWPANRQWIDAYLREELRQRLIARGWRANV